MTRRTLAVAAFVIALALPSPSLLAQTAWSTTPSVSWKDGKTTISTESAEMRISNRLQFRFTQEDPDSGSGRGSFQVRRARTKLDGWAYTKKLRYEVQFEWKDSSSPLLDCDIAFDVTGRGAFVVTAGQFKAPFGRQELVSATGQEFVDRSIVAAEFAKGRDIGVQLSGLAFGKTIDWRVGAFNGNGRNTSRNDNGRYQVDARLAWHPLGDPGYSESDIANSSRPLFSVAVAYENNDRRGATTGNDLLKETTGMDAVLKYRGLFAYGELFDRRNTPESGTAWSSRGLVLQAGYFVIPERLEIAGRWATIDPSTAVASDDRTESGVAVGWFVRGHNLKLQGDIRELRDDAKATTDREARVQMQLVF